MQQIVLPVVIKDLEMKLLEMLEDLEMIPQLMLVLMPVPQEMKLVLS